MITTNRQTLATLLANGINAIEPQSLTTEHAVPLAGVIDQEKQQRLLDYLELFIKWNKTYNLSAVRDPEAMVYRHLLDSISIVPHIQGEHIIDVGTGGGLPGIPLAIIFPEKKITLLDSNGKKMRFLFQVKTALNLSNVDIQNCRVESYKPVELYDIVTSRAFASLKDMTDNCHHLLKPSGHFLAMKGGYPEDELSEMQKRFKVSDCVPLRVPATDQNTEMALGDRHVLSIVDDNNHIDISNDNSSEIQD